MVRVRSRYQIPAADRKPEQVPEGPWTVRAEEHPDLAYPALPDVHQVAD